MTDEWLTMTEAAARLGVSERTVQRRVANGDYETKTEGGRKYVLLPIVGDADNNTMNDGQDADNQDDVSNKDVIIKMQREQIEMQKEQIEHLRQLLDDALQDARESKERADTIILTQSQRLDEQARMIEDMRQSTWQRIKRLFHKGASVQPA